MKTRHLRKTNKNAADVQFETAMRHYADAAHREALINATIESGMNELVAEYQDELQLLAAARQKAFETVQAYCINNKEKLFAKTRSIATLHGKAGFRLGTPRLLNTSGSSWDDIVAALKVQLPDYVRTHHEPAKDMLLADRHKENVGKVLMKLGMQVKQEELFYIHIAKAA
jgi:phage host-nuclease inhibitor protein Gam